MCSNVTKFPIHETKKKRSKPVMTNTTTPSAATTSSSSKGFSFLHRDNSYSPNQTVGVGRSHRDFHGTTSSSAVSSTIPTFPVQQTTKTTLTSPPDKTVSEKRVSLLDLEREMKKRRRESGGLGGTVTSSSSSSFSSTWRVMPARMGRGAMVVLWLGGTPRELFFSFVADDDEVVCCGVTRERLDCGCDRDCDSNGGGDCDGEGACDCDFDGRTTESVPLPGRPLGSLSEVA